MHRFTDFYYEDLIENKIQFNENWDIFDSLLTERRKSNVKKQPWAKDFKDLPTNNDDERFAAYDFVAKKYITVRTKKFESLMKHVSGKGAKILIGVKPADSFIDKVFKRGVSAGDIHDFLRGAILLKDDYEVEKVVKALKKKAIIFKYDYKEKGRDKDYGYYGSHHFKVDIDGVICEIQVMTKRLWTFKSPAHKVYEKYRSGDNDIKSKEGQRDSRHSKQLFSKGNASSKKRSNKKRRNRLR